MSRLTPAWRATSPMSMACSLDCGLWTTAYGSRMSSTSDERRVAGGDPRAPSPPPLPPSPSPSPLPPGGGRWGSAPRPRIPGSCARRWGRSGPPAVRLGVNSPFRLAMRSPERGAGTLVWLATSVPGRDWESGGYFADRKPATASPAAGDSGTWRESCGTARRRCAGWNHPPQAGLPRHQS